LIQYVSSHPAAKELENRWNWKRLRNVDPSWKTYPDLHCGASQANKDREGDETQNLDGFSVFGLLRQLGNPFGSVSAFAFCLLDPPHASETMGLWRWDKKDKLLSPYVR
jgi:hypothetical protein